MEEAVAGADVREEGVAQALPSVRPLHQASDVHHTQERGHLTADGTDKQSETVQTGAGAAKPANFVTTNVLLIVQLPTDADHLKDTIRIKLVVIHARSLLSPRGHNKN